MHKEMPSQVGLQKWVHDQPLDVIEPLPDCDHKALAMEHIRLAYANALVAHQRRCRCVDEEARRQDR